MTAKSLMEYVSFAEFFLSLGVLGVMYRRRLLKSFWPLATYLTVHAVMVGVDIPTLFFRRQLGISKLLTYRIMFYTSWPCIAIEAIMMMFIVHHVYRKMLQPFEPLKNLGMIIFRWVAGVSVVVSIGVAVGPHMFSRGYAESLISQIQQFGCIVTLCLLSFVCFALRPLGITARSRYFGICLGMGVIATDLLVQSAWLTATQAKSVYSIMYFWSGLAACMGLAIWGTYFILPEPASNIILLPTTSPYFFWNHISEVLGDAPGHVAIRGLTPDDLAPGELEALFAMSDAPEDLAPRIIQPIAANQ